MGLFDDALKKFKDKAGTVIPDDLKNTLTEAAGKLNEAIGPEGQKVKESLKDAFKQAADYLETAKFPGQPAKEASAPAVSDDYYDNVPEEENQYNYNGSWQAYFRHVFEEDFPDYRIFDEAGNNGRSTIFWFVKDGEKKLAVEIMTEKSNAKAFRRHCEKQGMPYLRFYHDHDGWWNTRSYVSGRVKAALGL